MSDLLDRLLSSDVTYRTLVVLLVLAFSVMVVCLTIIGWQTYQMGLATDRIFHHLLTS